MQALQKEAREVWDADFGHLSAEKDTVEEQSQALHLQCQQQQANLEALKRELAAAHEGRTAAIMKLKACTGQGPPPQKTVALNMPS